MEKDVRPQPPSLALFPSPPRRHINKGTNPVPSHIRAPLTLVHSSPFAGTDELLPRPAAVNSVSSESGKGIPCRDLLGVVRIYLFSQVRSHHNPPNISVLECNRVNISFTVDDV